MSGVATALKLHNGNDDEGVRQRKDVQDTVKDRPASSLLDDEEISTTEELLIEHLDKFLSSVESKLESFEQYFKAASKGEVLEQKVGSDYETSSSTSPSASPSRPLQHRRRDLTASLREITSYSIANLKSMYQRMTMIRGSVLKTSVTNLENLYVALEEHYQYFTKREDIKSESYNDFKQPVESSAPSAVFDSTDSVRQKIMTTLEYLDEKFTRVDNLIQAQKTPRAQDDYKSSVFRHFKYFNFNKALKSAEDRHLHYYELPLNWRENRYIINGYRFLMKHGNTLKSMFKFNHNESANIWTHGIGIFVVFYLAFYHFPSTVAYQKNTSVDNLPMYFFFFAALECFVSSVVWHTYSSFANYKIRSTCACIDYTGITVLITASVIAAEYCSLYAHPKFLRIYIGFSSLCGGAGFIFNWSPYFDKPECKSLRIWFFMGLAFLGASTAIVFCLYEGFMKSFLHFSPLFYKSFVWYWVGVVFYGGLIPERWRYDVIINEDESSCKHNRSVSEVIEGDIEHSGIEEMKEIEEEIGRLTSRNDGDVDEDVVDDEDPEHPHVKDPNREQSEEDIDDEYQNIIEKHFPTNPTLTPYHNDFLSLWWVDYFLASHNIWHVCVLFGVVGHYACIVDMYEQMSR